MDYFLETLLEPLLQVVLVVMLSTSLVQGARILARDIARRGRIRELAETRRWRFVGYVAPDGRDPYTRFERISWAVLLRYVVEGREHGFDFSVFEYRRTKYLWNTAALVLLDVAPLSCGAALSKAGSSSFGELEQVKAKIGPRTAAAGLEAFSVLGPLAPEGLVLEFGSGALFLGVARPPLDAHEIPILLEAAFRLAKAVVEDERSSSRARG